MSINYLCQVFMVVIVAGLGAQLTVAGVVTETTFVEVTSDKVLFMCGMESGGRGEKRFTGDNENGFIL
jgi:hypothetical protein